MRNLQTGELRCQASMLKPALMNEMKSFFLSLKAPEKKKKIKEKKKKKGKHRGVCIRSRS